VSIYPICWVTLSGPKPLGEEGKPEMLPCFLLDTVYTHNKNKTETVVVVYFMFVIMVEIPIEMVILL